MTDRDPELQRALDHLAMQVNRDNIEAVHKVFRKQADDLASCLQDLAPKAQMGLCGNDPVSRDVLGEQSFGGKINALLNIHRAHQEELVIASDHLHSIALSYGYTEDDIERYLSDTTS